MATPLRRGCTDPTTYLGSLFLHLVDEQSAARRRLSRTRCRRLGSLFHSMKNDRSSQKFIEQRTGFGVFVGVSGFYDYKRFYDKNTPVYLTIQYRPIFDHPIFNLPKSAFRILVKTSCTSVTRELLSRNEVGPLLFDAFVLVVTVLSSVCLVPVPVESNLLDLFCFKLDDTGVGGKHGIIIRTYRGARACVYVRAYVVPHSKF